MAAAQQRALTGLTLIKACRSTMLVWGMQGSVVMLPAHHPDRHTLTCRLPISMAARAPTVVSSISTFNIGAAMAVPRSLCGAWHREHMQSENVCKTVARAGLHTGLGCVCTCAEYTVYLWACIDRLAFTDDAWVHVCTRVYAPWPCGLGLQKGCRGQTILHRAFEGCRGLST